jgi:hypothetical protein
VVLVGRFERDHGKGTDRALEAERVKRRLEESNQSCSLGRAPLAR